MDWTETRNCLIVIDPGLALLPLEWQANIDLSGANLRGANIDFSCWPLWCGSFGVKTDIEQIRRLLYHICRVKCDDPTFAKTVASIRDEANTWSGIERHYLDKIE